MMIIERYETAYSNVSTHHIYYKQKIINVFKVWLLVKLNISLKIKDALKRNN